MARRSLRISSDGKSGTKHKRVASNTELDRDLAKRPKKHEVTPVKSQYFKDSADDQEEEDPDLALPDEASSSEQSVSDFEDPDDEAATASESNSSEDEEDESDDGPRPRKKGRQSTTSKSPANVTKESELWKPGVKTGLGPGKQVIIKKPKARSAGNTPYRDETIHPNTLRFLTDLKAHNKREWLKLNDADFRASERDFHGFVEKMSEKLMEIDDTIPELPVKDIIFRIYRDIRFSKDPTPYKPWFSVAWSRSGRKGRFAHYYLQIAPGKSLCGGGLWMPEAESLEALRREVDRNPQRIKEIISDSRLSNTFLGIPKKNDKQALKAFLKQNAESALKTRPKGYAADHPDIELMRLKNYTLMHKLSDDEVLGAPGVARVAELLSCLKPWVTYLNSVVMPDDPDSGDDDDDDDDGDDGEGEEGDEDDEAGDNDGEEESEGDQDGE